MSGILITGVSGYLGPYLCMEFAGRKDVYGIYNNHPVDFESVNNIKCDLTDLENLTRIFDEVKPDVVYHLASVTPTRITDQSDTYIEFFNEDVTAEIAKLCTKHNSLMIYTSTDLVYGEGTDIGEDSLNLDPLTIYAKTKLLGEKSVKEFAAKYLILRTALMYGFTLSSYTSFFDITYRALANGEPINAFIDQFRNPIYTEDAASILAALPDKYKENDTINLCGDETLSRYEMCVRFADIFSLKKSLIIPANCEEYTQYTMVKKLALNSRKLKAYGFVTNPYNGNLHKSKKYKP